MTREVGEGCLIWGGFLNCYKTEENVKLLKTQALLYLINEETVAT
jgi:hypothetical protein